MEASIQWEHGYVVHAYVTDEFAGKGSTGMSHWQPVVNLPCQSDAIEFRNLLLRDGMREGRLKLLIRNYDGTPKKISRWASSGEPDFRRIHDDEMKYYY